MDRSAIYEYSSVQVNVPQVIADRIIKWGNDNIRDEELYGEHDPILGREDEIHITILYGIRLTSPQKINFLLSKHSSFPVGLGEVSLFTTNSNFDVLKIEVTGSYLFYLNKILRDNIEHCQMFPTYKPHVTIAYLNKGVGEHLIGCKEFRGIGWNVSTIIFSSKNGEKTPIRLQAG